MKLSEIKEGQRFYMKGIEGIYPPTEYTKEETMVEGRYAAVPVDTNLFTIGGLYPDTEVELVNTPQQTTVSPFFDSLQQELRASKAAREEVQGYDSVVKDETLVPGSEKWNRIMEKLESAKFYKKEEFTAIGENKQRLGNDVECYKSLEEILQDLQALEVSSKIVQKLLNSVQMGMYIQVNPMI